MDLQYFTIICVLSGFSLVAMGLLISRYRQKEGLVLKQMLYSQFNTGMNRRISNRATIFTQKAFGFLSRNKKGLIYRWDTKVLQLSESTLTVETLYLLKIICLIATILITVAVRHTNIDIMKTSIISRPQGNISLFVEPGVNEYTRNAALYTAVVKNIGEEVLKNLDDKQQLMIVGKELSSLLCVQDKEVLDEQARMVVNTFRQVDNIRLIDIQTLVLIFLSFWLPEGVLIVRWLLLGNMYRKEVIKLENIFELLGSVKGMKTIDIVTEMAKASKVYRKHLTRCIELFKTEKEQALERLKVSARNTRFARLVDVLRVYSMTDKHIAMQIMERNRLEREEEILLTAEEDIDMVDLVAFISIVPILLQLANLLMKPMLDMIYEVFNFV